MKFVPMKASSAFLCVLLCALCVDSFADSPWRPLPVFGGGTVLNALVAPSDPSRWYAFCDVCGPYRSDDGGKSWIPLHASGMPLEMRQSLRADEVRDLSIDPRDADTFVMVSGDKFNKPAGAYVSHDGGRTFRQTLTARFYGDGDRRRLGRCLARHPANPDVLVCGEDWDGLFRSDDGGETWRPLGLEKTWITDIRWDADDPERLYVCAPGLPIRDSRHHTGDNPREREAGFFRSDDGGLSWRKLSGESPLETAQIPGSQRIVGIFDDGRTAPAGGRFVRVSDDLGETWRPFGEGLPVLPEGTETPPPIHRDPARFQSLAAGPDFWLVGNGPGQIFRRGSDDAAWEKIPRKPMKISVPGAEDQLRHHAERGDMWSLATISLDPHDPAHWLATDWFAVWETTDAGTNWTLRVNGLANVVPFCIECDPHSPDNIIYGIADMGLSCSHDGGRTFHAVPQTGGANTAAWCRRHPGVAFATGGKFGTQFIRTLDGGRTWTGDFPKRGLPDIPVGAPHSPDTLCAYTVAVDPSTDDVYLCVGGPMRADGGGVWVSHDLGDSFERFSKGLPEGKSLFKTSEFSGGSGAGWPPELVFGADGSAVLITWKGTCYYLDRETGAWHPTPDIENKRINFTIAADPFEPGRFLMAQCWPEPTLHESTDGGRSWHVLATGEWIYNSIAFDPHVPGLAAVASNDGIRLSRDGGRTFGDPIPDGYDFPAGDKRWIGLDRGRLFGFTRGSGVWVRAVPSAPSSLWHPLPVFGGGTVLNALVAPSDPTRWYAFCDVCGPYRSDDGGKSWTPLHARMPIDMRVLRADEVRSLSIDPRDADSFVMAGGREFDKPAGIYVSRDGGRTFRRTLTARFYGDGDRRRLGQCIARNPANPDVLVCGEDWDGLFRSDDNGETWRSLGLKKTWITDIRWDSDDPDRLYVCAPDLPVPIGGHVRPWNPHEREAGFFRSDDGGTTWTKLPGESPSETAQIPGSPRIVGIFGGRHVRVSDDFGETWSPFAEGLPTLPEGAAPPPINKDEARFQSLAAGPDFWLVGNTVGDIYRRDGGAMGTWEKIPRASMATTHPGSESHIQRFADKGVMWSLATISLDPHDSAHWLATDWFAIWETTDAGTNWTSRVNGLANVVPFCIACDPNSPDNILYGMADMGMDCSHDGGRTFHSVPQTGGANTIAWCRRHTGVAFATGGKQGIQFIRTFDGGRTWAIPPAMGLPPFRKGWAGDPAKEFSAYTVAVDPTTDDVYLCVGGPVREGGGGVWVSHDLGDTFERFSKGFPDGDTLFKTSEFAGGGAAGWPSELVFGEDGSAILSTWHGPCRRLDRESGEWLETTVTNSYKAWPLNYTVAADPHEPGRFLMAQIGTLLETVDGGRSWRVLATGDWIDRSVAFDPFMPGLVAMPSSGGIRLSRDGGRSFGDPLPDGLAFPTGGKWWVALDRGRLFGFTFGSGVWVRELKP